MSELAFLETLQRVQLQSIWILISLGVCFIKWRCSSCDAESSTGFPYSKDSTFYQPAALRESFSIQLERKRGARENNEV